MEWMLTFEDEKLVLINNDTDERHTVRSVTDICAKVDFELDNLFCSSSIDFPEESTSDLILIDVCRQVR